MWKEFKEFALKGSVLDLAIGIIIGASFAPIIKSLVDDIIMPPIGLLLGGVDFTNLFLVLRDGMPPGPYATLEAARTASAVTINYGLFVNTIITFLIVAFAIFLMVKMINRWRAQEPAETNTRECPQCLSTIPLKASRCAFCASQIGATSA
ncbi:MAG TPA: large-conductance mechanosensitive channel protein MscL [Gemmatimonadota bacterium]|nr:large-conductance mechanosensitive channel protein MscL [Gemmatimonadota bacterium]